MSMARQSFISVALSLVCGAIGLLILGIQPVLYAAYVREGSITEQHLGTLAAVEFISVALGSGAAVPLVHRIKTHWIAMGGVLLLCAGNIFPVAHGQGAALFALRMVAGVGGGLLGGIAAAAIARTDRVGGWSGAFFCIQALAQVIVMSWFTVLAPAAASDEIQLSMAMTGAAMLPLVFFLPRFVRSGPAAETVRLRPAGRGWIGLGAMFLSMGGAIGIWAYLGVWLSARGMPFTSANTVITACLAGQAAGAFLAAFPGDGPYAWGRLIVLKLAWLAALGLWLANPGSTVLAFIYGALWIGTMPSYLSTLLLIDPERRAIPYGTAAQLSGSALIPTLVGEIFASSSLDDLMIASTVILFASLLVMLSQTSHLLARRPFPAAPAQLASTLPCPEATTTRMHESSACQTSRNRSHDSLPEAGLEG